MVEGTSEFAELILAGRGQALRQVLRADAAGGPGHVADGTQHAPGEERGSQRREEQGDRRQRQQRPADPCQGAVHLGERVRPLDNPNRWTRLREGAREHPERPAVERRVGEDDLTARRARAGGLVPRRVLVGRGKHSSLQVQEKHGVRGAHRALRRAGFEVARTGRTPGTRSRPGRQGAVHRGRAGEPHSSPDRRSPSNRRPATASGQRPTSRHACRRTPPRTWRPTLSRRAGEHRPPAPPRRAGRHSLRRGAGETRRHSLGRGTGETRRHTLRRGAGETGRHIASGRAWGPR